MILGRSVSIKIRYTQYNIKRELFVMTSWFPMALRIAKFLARRHLHRLVLHLLATYSLFFPREEERIACRSETVTLGTSPDRRSFEKDNSISVDRYLLSSVPDVVPIL